MPIDKKIEELLKCYRETGNEKFLLKARKLQQQKRRK
jgi:hypothetical protein